MWKTHWIKREVCFRWRVWGNLSSWMFW